VFTKYSPIRFVLWFLGVVILAACAPAVAAPVASAPSPQPAATSVASAPSPQPAATELASSPPSQPTPTPDRCPCFEGLSSGLDNATQARIRTINMLMGAPRTDVYVNGLPASNGGVMQQGIGVGQFSSFLYVKPGTYTIALVPNGGTLDQALFPPAEVKVEAGRRYTVAAVGQLADKDAHPLVVDEMAVEAGVTAAITDTVNIDINNLKGADSITEMAWGQITAENIKYGEARAWVNASGTPHFKSLAKNGETSGVIFEGDDSAEPGISVAIPYFGPFPADNYDTIGEISQGTSELNVMDFLAGFDGRDVSLGGHPVSFNTLVAAIKKAALQDQLVNGEPYFLLAPTDEAFAALPQADLEALLDDPQALQRLFKAHIIDGYYPWGSFSGSTYGTSDRTLSNQAGDKLYFEGDTLNGYPIGKNFTVGNGIRVQVIYNLLPYK
jgi:hypothetical protein